MECSTSRIGGMPTYENDDGKTSWYSQMRSRTAGSRSAVYRASSSASASARDGGVDSTDGGGTEVEMGAMEIEGGSGSRGRSSTSVQGGSSCKTSVTFTIKKVTSSCRMKWANCRGEVTVIEGEGVGTEGSGRGGSGHGVAVVPMKGTRYVCPHFVLRTRVLVAQSASVLRNRRDHGVSRMKSYPVSITSKCAEKRWRQDARERSVSSRVRKKGRSVIEEALGLVIP
ncbi:hypothetical protein CBR_g21081 [Chara braunii]|uniref:Uncharacterized protein n=1 Tax=Chara braunii TaxID=69332 RepID=A0A388L0K5_CHABU|nr:hypothetical protein CBR_g21081 [Chara braunii]|eukprot:GBG75837.1 hypothetical protein CBR_g21081 [Chara braunii]